MLKSTRLFVLLVLFAPLLVSCDKDEENPIEENEAELITTVKLTLVNKANTTVTEIVTATWRDPEGDGNPIVTDLVLKPGATYEATIEFLDESNPTDVEDITTEIEGESDDHELFYTVNNVALTVSRDDTDSKGLPIGLKTTFTAITSGTGTLKITLKHKPDGLKKAGDAVSVGATDAEPEFPVKIQ